MPANAPSIDVLLATYNGARYLRPQIESVLNQKDVSFRILVRDDGSADETPAVIEHYKRLKPECIVHLSGSDNLGVIGNFAHLLGAATAPYVALCDQDDIWEPNKLRVLLETMHELEERHGIDKPLLVHSDLRVVDDSLRERHSSYWRFAGVYPNRSTLPRLLIKNLVAGCASLANQALVRLALPVPRAALMHDYWLALVACAAGHVGAVEEPLVLYRQHERNAIGARPYSWRAFVDRIAGGLARWDLSALRRQAAALSVRCNSVLTAENRALIDDFVNLPKRTWIGQRWFLLRHGIVMPGLTRNLVLFFCIRLGR
jgi:glycosyltransferase involved in cell wall biosynthesis